MQKLSCNKKKIYVRQNINMNSPFISSIFIFYFCSGPVKDHRASSMVCSGFSFSHGYVQRADSWPKKYKDSTNWVHNFALFLGFPKAFKSLGWLNQMRPQFCTLFGLSKAFKSLGRHRSNDRRRPPRRVCRVLQVHQKSTRIES